MNYPTGTTVYCRLGEVVLPGEVFSESIEALLVRLGDLGVVRVWKRNAYLDEGDAIAAEWKAN